MNYDNVLLEEERVGLDLRALYRQYGYQQFRMSKFEEYDLYVRNKDFLLSDAVITFTDLSGRLLALKPDVTLSIIKNTRDEEGLKKLYYDEKVYRPAGMERSFREINQVGLECVGLLDDYTVSEVIFLAGESLCRISESFRLNVSHLGILSALLEETGLPEDRKQALNRFLSEKNEHELRRLLSEYQVPRELSSRILSLARLHGSPDRVLPLLRELTDAPAVEELSRILAPIAECPWSDNLILDFSGVSDMKYYNGIMLTGFIEGVPSPVLSGGRYDPLLRRMGRRSGAIGFAVYLDLLERLEPDRPYDVDVLLVYGPGEDPVKVKEAADALASEGNSVAVLPEGQRLMRARRSLSFREGEVRPR